MATCYGKNWELKETPQFFESLLDGGSTMGLGAVREGAQAPRNVQVRTFPDTVVQQVPKVQDYKNFAAENRVAVVDPRGSKVELVIEDRR